ncbi:Pyrin [Chelonia mydas]|uniref:Pyrin n=1 Tax=Chelonia mydas TaxID=8469 RepID=M7AXB0_CHEMY|nr:Pyrin [Chelonia mydas]
MERTGRALLLEALDDLGWGDLKRFKKKLRAAQLEKGYKAIPWGQLEKGDPVDVSNLLISHYGECYGVEVTVQVLGDINQRGSAELVRNEPGREQGYLTAGCWKETRSLTARDAELLEMQPCKETLSSFKLHPGWKYRTCSSSKKQAEIIRPETQSDWRGNGLSAPFSPQLISCVLLPIFCAASVSL